jgi:hypothetical protein
MTKHSKPAVRLTLRGQVVLAIGLVTLGWLSIYALAQLFTMIGA